MSAVSGCECIVCGTLRFQPSVFVTALELMRHRCGHRQFRGPMEHMWTREPYGVQVARRLAQGQEKAGTMPRNVLFFERDWEQFRSSTSDSVGREARPC